jgi:uncharacterized membrane protein YagU involved in acid resistance
MTLYWGCARRRIWLVFGAGSIAYASGHGIHLAANSVANASPGPTAHLWDEVVGHYIWYVGVALCNAWSSRLPCSSGIRNRPENDPSPLSPT